MKRSLVSLSLLIVVLVIFAVVGYVAPEKVVAPVSTSGISDLIVVTLPVDSQKISSPLTVSGRARGHWFFEASAPVFVVDWDGKIVGQGIITADGEWMTENFVPFKGTITFTTPTDVGGFSNKGAVIFKNDNPSGDPARDKAIEVPVFFER